jgi:hypothetical protein
MAHHEARDQRRRTQNQQQTYCLQRQHERQIHARCGVEAAGARGEVGGRRIETFRYQLRKRIAAILRARSAELSAEAAREMAIVVLQLIKAANMLAEEEGLSGRVARRRELAVMFVERHLKARRWRASAVLAF